MPGAGDHAAVPEQCRILIAGAGKSGTSGLFHCVLRSAELHYGIKFDRLFEPREQEKLDAFTGRFGISKILIERLRTFDDPETIIGSFGKRILIVRDPRDNVISRLMWQVATRIDEASPADAAAIMEALRRKERDPGSISVYDLFLTAAPAVGHGDNYALQARRLSYFAYDLVANSTAFHVLKYEDFVDRALEASEAYLGFPLLRDFDLPERAEKILRTGRYGNWVNWFLDKDYDFFVDTEAEKLARLGYANERPKVEERVILPEEITEYVARVQASRQMQHKVHPPGRRKARRA